MALTATIFKARLSVSDLDRHVFAEHALTLARHPSETDERLMVRLLAFALNADERLEFTRGLCADDEPELWQRDATGALEVWIEVGLPDEKRLRRACGRAPRVVLYSYGGHAAQLWWERNAAALRRLDNLTVVEIPAAASRELAALADRSLQLQVTVQDGQLWLDNGATTLEIRPEVRTAPA